MYLLCNSSSMLHNIGNSVYSMCLLRNSSSMLHNIGNSVYVPIMQ